MAKVTVQRDMKASDKTFEEGLAALESLRDGEFWRIFRETQEEGRKAVEAVAITEKHRVFWDHAVSWVNPLSALIKKAFEKYTALAVANSQFVEGELIEWIEARVQQFLEPRLGHKMKVAHPDQNRTSEMSFAEIVTGGQKAHKWITYWVAEVSEGEGQDLGYSVGDEEEGELDWELDDEAVDSWQAPAWLAHGFLQKETLDGRLDAKTTALEVGLIHFELWIKLEEALERGRLAAKVEIAASTSPELEQLEIEQHKQDTKKGKECIAIFPSPPGLRWEDVTIAFISDTEIRVEAKGRTEQFSYDEIGLDDKRDGTKGNLWFVFRALAMLKGSATVDNLANASKDKNNVSKDISRLRKILYKLMCIKGNPFHNYKNYKKHQYYQTKFKLRDEKYGGVLKKD